MERAVLANVQRRHVKSERPQESDQRVEFVAGNIASAHFDQRLAQEEEVGDDAIGGLVLTGSALAHGLGETQADEVDILTPGFADIALQGGFTGFALDGRVLFDLLHKDRGRELEVVAQRKALTEGLQALISDI